MQLVKSQNQFMAEEKQFRNEQRQTNAKHEQSIQRFKVQMGQLAKEMNVRKQGELPTQTIPNPGGHQQVQAVTTLKNSKIIGVDEPTQVSPDEASTSKVSKMEREYPPPPFPQRLVKPKKEKNLFDIFEILRKVKINIHLLDAIQQIPTYAKFFKDCCTHKRKF
jgi:hypothetical protein